MRDRRHPTYLPGGVGAHSSQEGRIGNRMNESNPSSVIPSSGILNELERHAGETSVRRFFHSQINGGRVVGRTDRPEASE
jgi:hypothetical protein